jgi:hypothetical protein
LYKVLGSFVLLYYHYFLFLFFCKVMLLGWILLLCRLFYQATPWHLKILKFLDEIQFEDNSDTSEESSIDVLDRVINNLAELKGERAFTNRIIRELGDHGLILKDIDPRTPLEGVGNTYKRVDSFQYYLKYMIYI